MDNMVYCLSFNKCPLTVYIGETGLACAWLHTHTRATYDSRADKGWVMKQVQKGVMQSSGIKSVSPTFERTRSTERALVPVLLCITHHLKSGVLTSLPTLFPPCVTAHAFTQVSYKWVIMKMKKWSWQWTQFMQCVKKPEKKFRTSKGFESVTLRYRCDALPTELWSHWLWSLLPTSVAS